MEPMDPGRRVEEAHGLWELAIARLAAFVECGAKPTQLAKASADERGAFENWQRVSRECGA